MYRVISIGVNGIGKNRLRFAEKDARDFFRAFTSALGPPNAFTSYRCGPRATPQEIIDLLKAAAAKPPEFLCIFASCHGNATGLALFGGQLSFAELARRLRAIRAKAIVLIVDACGAGGFMRYAEETQFGVEGILKRSWAEALADAVPGLRVYLASSATAKSREGGNVQNGHFTRAVIDTMFSAAGELCVFPFRYVSDRELIDGVTEYMGGRWPADAVPMAFGVEQGTFPLLLSQAHGPIGRADVRRFDLGTRPVARVEVGIWGRKHVPTFVRCSLIDRFDVVLGVRSARVEPPWDHTFSKRMFEFDWNALARNPFSRLEFDAGWPVAVNWQIEVVDQHFHVLASEVLATSWRRWAA